jgi:hypothetical protein
MRRLLFALAFGLVAAPAGAADLYYTQTGGDRNVYAVNASGGTPRIVLSSAEYTGPLPSQVTWRNHAGSNGQALLHGTSSGAYPNPEELELIYRDPSGAVVTKQVTDLGSAASPFKPYYSGGLAKDDSFFSVRVYDGQGTSRVYKLHVSVDEALAAGYVPPNSYDDPRLELVYSGYLSPQTGNFKAFFHDWSGDGTRGCVEDLYQGPDGTLVDSFVVKRLSDGAAVTLYETPYANSHLIGAGLRWSPTSDQILQPYSDGSGIFMLHADTPGLKTWAIQRTTYKTKTGTNTDAPDFPFWRPDGQAYAFALERTVQPTRGTATSEHYPSVTTGGWPSLNLTTTRPSKVHPIGWTP